jgi:hypothetical protein
VRVACVVALLLLPRVVAGQEAPAQPVQELFFTEVVYPQDRGEFQFTLGARIDRAESPSSSLVPLAVEYGITDHWQVEAGWDGYSLGLSSPFSDLQTARLSVGTKYSLMNIAHSRIHAAFGTDFEFPRASALDEGEDGMEIEPFAALAADLGWHLTVFGSVAASIQAHQAADAIAGERPDDRGTIGAGALVAYRRFTVAVEYTNRSDALPWRLDGSSLLTPSIVIHPHGSWEIGAGFPIGLHGSHQAGFTINIIKEFG